MAGKFASLYLKESTESVNEAYKGLHPKKIKSVYGDSTSKGLAHIETNDGTKHKVWAKDTGGKMPKLGEHIDQYVKESTTDELTNEGMEFTPHGGAGTLKDVPVPASNTGAPPTPPVGHVDHPAPGLTEPKTVVNEVPKTKLTEAQIQGVLEAFKAALTTIQG